MGEHNTEHDTWSKYQMLILQQLEDHRTVLENLNKELSTVREKLGILEVTFTTNIQTLNEKTNNLDSFEHIKEITDKIQQVREHNNILEAENAMWKTQVKEQVNSLEEDMHFIFYEDKGFEKRIQTLEQNTETLNKIDSYKKAQWALYVSIGVALINLVTALLKV